MSNIYDNETMRQSTPTEDEMINQKIWGGITRMQMQF